VGRSILSANEDGAIFREAADPAKAWDTQAIHKHYRGLERQPDNEPDYDRVQKHLQGNDEVVVPPEHGAVFYHSTDAELKPGDKLLPRNQTQAPSQFGWGKTPGMENRDNFAWMYADPRDARIYVDPNFGHGEPRQKHTYAVTPNDEPQPWNGSGIDGWVADSATVNGEIDPKALGAADKGFLVPRPVLRALPYEVGTPIRDYADNEYYGESFQAEQGATPQQLRVLTQEGFTPPSVNMWGAPRPTDNKGNPQDFYDYYHADDKKWDSVAQAWTQYQKDRKSQQKAAAMRILSANDDGGIFREASATPHIGPIAEYDPDMYADLPPPRGARTAGGIPWAQFLDPTTGAAAAAIPGLLRSLGPAARAVGEEASHLKLPGAARQLSNQGMNAVIPSWERMKEQALDYDPENQSTAQDVAEPMHGLKEDLGDAVSFKDLARQIGVQLEADIPHMLPHSTPTSFEMAQAGQWAQQHPEAFAAGAPLGVGGAYGPLVVKPPGPGPTSAEEVQGSVPPESRAWSRETEKSHPVREKVRNKLKSLRPHPWATDVPAGTIPTELTGSRRYAATKARYILLPHWDPEACVDIMHDHAADMGYRIALQVTPALMEQARGGGFTLHDHVGDGPTSGYMVSLAKNAEQTVPMKHLTPQVVQNFVNKHSRDLKDPSSYLGGWLEGPNFYLDISHHRPSLSQATRDAAANEQLGIYDLTHGTTIPTQEAAAAGIASATGVLPAMVGMRKKGGRDLSHVHPKHLLHHTQLPVHNWETHYLGDPEHWEPAQQIVGKVLDATGGHAFPGIAQLDPHGTPAGGSHGAEIRPHPVTGEKWLVKHSPSTQNGQSYDAPFFADADVAASAIQAASGLTTPPTFLDQSTPKGGTASVPASAQLAFDAKDAFPGGTFHPDALSDQDLLTMQKHHALDWALGNHDSHGKQFIRDSNTGELVGVDKTQAFKHFSQDKLDWDFHPNSAYNEKEPVYNTLYRNYANGGRELNDPRKGELGAYIQGLQGIPDEDYKDTLRPYAEHAAKYGNLAKSYGHVHGDAARFPANDVESFLQAAVDRKNHLMADFAHLYKRARAFRRSGFKAAARTAAQIQAGLQRTGKAFIQAELARHKTAAIPDPKEMREIPAKPGETGSHSGSKFYEDPQGQWIVKRPNAGNEFLPALDAATADLQRRSGLETPETYAMPWEDGMATAVKLYKGPHGEERAPQRWDRYGGPHFNEMTPKEQLTVQKHHALDWLIANHDAHAGNWMATDHGLVGIDKGQALKYLGQDHLDYNFHPNWYARPPIHNRLWREYAQGKGGEMLDPRQGELGEFIKGVQNIPDDEIKQMFGPYAHAAARAGKLATGVYGGGHHVDPNRGLHDPDFPANDPEQFLNYLVNRKHNLMNDLGKFYDQNKAEREHNIAHPPPPKPKYQPSTPGGGHWSPHAKPWFLQPGGHHHNQYTDPAELKSKAPDYMNTPGWEEEDWSDHTATAKKIGTTLYHWTTPEQAVAIAHGHAFHPGDEGKAWFTNDKFDKSVAGVFGTSVVPIEVPDHIAPESLGDRYPTGNLPGEEDRYELGVHPGKIPREWIGAPENYQVTETGLRRQGAIP